MTLTANDFQETMKAARLANATSAASQRLNTYRQNKPKINTRRRVRLARDKVIQRAIESNPNPQHKRPRRRRVMREQLRAAGQFRQSLTTRKQTRDARRVAAMTQQATRLLLKKARAIDKIDDKMIDRHVENVTGVPADNPICSNDDATTIAATVMKDGDAFLVPEKDDDTHSVMS